MSLYSALDLNDLRTLKLYSEANLKTKAAAAAFEYMSCALHVLREFIGYFMAIQIIFHGIWEGSWAFH